MKRSRGKMITVIAGAGALIITAVFAAGFRREIYDWLYPPPVNEPVIWSWPEQKAKFKEMMKDFKELPIDIDQVIIDMEERPLEDPNQAGGNSVPSGDGK